MEPKTTSTSLVEERPATGAPPRNDGPAPLPSEPAKKKPPYALMIGAAVVVLVGGIFGVKWWMHQQAFVSTDDAQVSGNLVSVSSRVAGHVQTLKVDEGQTVKAGQVLATLDPADFQTQVAQAQAALQAAQTNLAGSQVGVTQQAEQTTSQIAQSQANIAAAQAGVTQAIANARKAQDDLRAYGQLYAEGGLSRQAYEQAQTAAATAQAAVATAEGQLHAAQAGLGLAETGNQATALKRENVQATRASIAQAQAQLNAAKLNLQHTVITAPSNGIIAKREVNAGEQVSPGQTLLTEAETDQLWVTANVEETNIRRVHQGAPVNISVDAFPHQIFHGTVDYVNAATGAEFSLLPENNTSGNFTKVVQRIPVRINVQDPNHMLKPGMSVVVDIDARYPNK